MPIFIKFEQENIIVIDVSYEYNIFTIKNITFKELKI